jgi:hypothetical protein
MYDDDDNNSNNNKVDDPADMHLQTASNWLTV